MQFLALILLFVAITGISGTYNMPPPPTHPPPTPPPPTTPPPTPPPPPPTPPTPPPPTPPPPTSPPPTPPPPTFPPTSTTKHNGCTVEGYYYSCGTFEDPRDRCSECQCYPENTLKCVKKPCGEPHCGYEMQEPTPDNCCKRCLPECALIDCPICDCPLEQRYFRPNSCCPECRPEDDSSEEDPKTPYDDVRCRKDGKYYRCGTFEDPEDKCNICTCYRDSIVKCHKKLCSPLSCGYKRQIQPNDGCCKRCESGCGRCPRLTCYKQIIPADACCPVCLYNPDSSSSDSGSSESIDSSGNSGTSESTDNSGSSESTDNSGNSGSSESTSSRANSGSSESTNSSENSGSNEGENSGSNSGGNSGSSSAVSEKSGRSGKDSHGSSASGQSGSNNSSGGNTSTGKSGSSGSSRSPSSGSGSHDNSGSGSSGGGVSGCDKNGHHYESGDFVDPEEPCNICTCYTTGHFDCKKRTCKPPKCGVNKQKKDECGCLVPDDSCKDKVCLKLECPAEQRYFAPDSCCEACQCSVNGVLVPEGPFDDPCNTCECFANGQFKCHKRPCNPPKCGVNKQKKNECGCLVSDDSCKDIVCPKLECPEDQRYFAPDSCCQACQCSVNGVLIPEGPFDDPCNTCECFANGQFDCQKRPCEPPRCGVKKQKKNECGCFVPDDSCKDIVCPKLECPKVQRYFAPDSCCEACQCSVNGVMVPKGPFKDPCNTCECFANGQFACQLQPCEPPKCGVNKQKKDECGCLVPDDSCKDIVCPKLECPKDQRYFAPDSCCEACQCSVNGVLVPEGPFNDPCNTCECFANGQFNCEKRPCDPPKCGVNKQKKNECGCLVPDDSCKDLVCPKLECPEDQRYFAPESCCETCQCSVNGVLVPEGPFEDHCDACVCKGGVVTCSPPTCPTEPLECVDPVVDENCNWICPNGANCMINPAKGLEEGNKPTRKCCQSPGKIARYARF
ncbi:HMU-like protein [Mya arenaria]|uniref:HMU-like protein n=1 Tax=Mya arenaria TaxID=6604 RepID=A0ABY7DA24_MYAAR|nr:HMU-like protein [Mya arenaria]